VSFQLEGGQINTDPPYGDCKSCLNGGSIIPNPSQNLAAKI